MNALYVGGTVLASACPDCKRPTLRVDDRQPLTRPVVCVTCQSCRTELEINRSAIGRYL